LGRQITTRFAAFQGKITHDFERLERTKNQMEFMALHDSLTGLPNRTQLHMRIRQEIELTKKNSNKLAVMFVDLDDFKKINDAYGHNSGDKLLQKLSMEFNDLAANEATVSRFGGDEFIFSFPNMASIRDIERKVESIGRVFTNEFQVDGHTMKTGCSIGVSVYPDDGDDPEDLITKADIVLYKSKAKEKGRALFYDQTINEQVQYDFKLEKKLRSAVALNEIYVVYQPQINASTGKLSGLEALARWNNAELGEISPSVFISIAEDIGSIFDISWFVINSACHDFATIQSSVQDPLHLSINISPKQLLQNDFADKIHSAVIANKIDPHCITLEITENVLLDDLQQVKPVLEALRDCGFGLSLDDFGTGYSSLSYINSLPLTEIKIDRTFVDNLLTQTHSESLVVAILAIGKASHLQVVAEGVETEAQANRLRELKCDWLQGYFFNKPISVAQLIEEYKSPR
jgi:diguanylate cyclase (GGDEF)-like protein